VTDSRWDRLELLVQQGTSLPPSERAAFVARETSNDPTLGAELASVLEASDGAGEYLGRLRQELLGSGVDGMLREAAAAGEGPDPWIGRTVSHYEIVERIGGGGMGVIYRARDLRLHRTVALKFIAPEIRRDPHAERRFLDEARAASALDHPNICTIHEIGETEGRQFIVMPAYDGESLRSRLERPLLPEQEALAIARQIAQALAAAHERGIVHGDVNPDNVFLTRDGVVKLLDFGLARMADHRMSGPGSVAGTVAYMSPEQVGGQRADARSDVWASGVMLFEMLAGVRPFAANDPRGVLDQIVNREPNFAALPSGLPLEVSTAMRRALTKDPAGRFATGRELLQALTQRPPVTVAVPRRPIRRRTLGMGATAAGLLVIVATLVALRIRANADAPAADTRGELSVSHALWVDDNPENNGVVIRQLESRGIRLTTMLSTAEAVERFDPTVHELVISDMGRFQGANNSYVERAGRDLLSTLKARSADVRLVFCTSARAAATYRTEALAAGALGIVEDCGDVLRMVR